MSTDISEKARWDSHPHWRFLIRPSVYPDEPMSTDDAWKLVERCQIRKRGWPFPIVDKRPNAWAYLSSYCECRTSDKWQPPEYWRMYRSGQFLHLRGVKEAFNHGYREKMLAGIKNDPSRIGGADPQSIKGVLSVINLIYTFTEVIEFSARLAQSPRHSGMLQVVVSLHKAQGYVLTAGEERGWDSYNPVGDDSLHEQFQWSDENLIAETTACVARVCQWFFSSCGWTPSDEFLRKEIDDFRLGRS